MSHVSSNTSTTASASTAAQGNRTFAARMASAPYPSPASDRRRRVHFPDGFTPHEDPFQPSSLELRLNLGPPGRVSLVVKIEVIFENGRLPKIKVRTKKPRAARRREAEREEQEEQRRFRRDRRNVSRETPRERERRQYVDGQNSGRQFR
ncbi:hypothetical protein EJ03DRAFT_208563 [Teratosphaeria nubilosa]|uniref:Uncharacterized protein n=1 Tax=Teratosphaeria nubilosa TaxID=161662 RepID=A0A6G1KYL1_9PEZI|nr:hypothetical protein EJ03DRAFT_208563 [Teratosphaeria nubilosa]